MNLSEINFTFAGKHCLRDFGCIYVESGGHTISPQVSRNEYTIAGMSGTLEMGHATHQPFTSGGTLYFWRSPPSQAEAQRMLRRIVAWLRQGRERLFFDYETARYYLADVRSPTQWTYASWIDGGLDIEFACQPFAYNRFQSEASGTTTSYGATLVLATDTAEPAPLGIEIKNTGTAPITSVMVTAGARRATFNSGLSIAAGRTFALSMEPPAGATIDGADAMPTCTRFDYITAPPGPIEVVVALNYGSGTRGAQIRAHARGRF